MYKDSNLIRWIHLIQRIRFLFISLSLLSLSFFAFRNVSSPLSLRFWLYHFSYQSSSSQKRIEERESVRTSSLHLHQKQSLKVSRRRSHLHMFLLETKPFSAPPDLILILVISRQKRWKALAPPSPSSARQSKQSPPSQRQIYLTKLVHARRKHRSKLTEEVHGGSRLNHHHHEICLIQIESSLQP